MKPIHLKPSRSQLWLLSFVVNLLLLASRRQVTSAPPDFRYLGDLPGCSGYSVARGVSADGTYVVGDSRSSNADGCGTEAFIWDATNGIVGLGDAVGGAFDSSAVDVSADGRYAVGHVTELRGISACRWSLGPPITRSVIHRVVAARTVVDIRATAISSSGDVVVGSESLVFTLGEIEPTLRAFRWTTDGLTWLDQSLDPLPWSTATAVSPDGAIAVGGLAGVPGSEMYAYKSIVQGFEPIGAGVGFREALGVSADGNRAVGWDSGERGFLWKAEGPISEFPQPLVGISADGRVVLDAGGNIYVDDLGPFDLREILAVTGGEDLTHLSPGQFRAHAISDNGLCMVGSAEVGGEVKAWRACFQDSDQNGIPDEIEQFACGINGNVFLTSIVRGTELFKSDLRETTGYADMLPFYGLPWKRGVNRVPTRDETQPAEFLRAVLLLASCPEGPGIETDSLATAYLSAVAFPAVAELHAYEMLLGNEAFADALDPTIGLDGLDADDLSDAFAFKGVPGIEDLLDEELALLRGRDLPGQPADWVNETTYYPEIPGPGGAKRSAAIYNRLPPNAGDAGTAYKSNYAVGSNFDAAAKFPQGHGDAYGHYLTAIKAAVALLRDGPEALQGEYRDLVAGLATSDASALETVRRLAEAAVARARTAMEVSELHFRRDYRENPEDSRNAQLFRDPQPDRAWSMGEWARRGALGAYLDWAVVAHWAPTDEGLPVRRENLPELDELTGALIGFQERLDAGGSGLDPLGLVQNVVPFGIDASALQPGTGRSHFEQVYDAANRALENARKAFETANEAGQRLRDTDRTFTDFAERLEDTRADHDQQLIELCGLPSPDDPQDNDLDPATDDFEESQSHPDLTNFLATEEDLAASGMRPRPAPGQIQLGMSELRVSSLRLDQAGLALDELGAQIRSKIERIELLTEVQAQQVEIVSGACSQQVTLTRRLEDIEKAAGRWGLVKSIGKAVFEFAKGNPDGAFDLLKAGANWAAEKFIAGTTDDKYDIEVERQRVQCWKELQLQGLENTVVVDAETRELVALIRHSPQLFLDQAAAAEVMIQALGRLQQAISRAQLLLKTKQRLESRTQGDLSEQRWKDMSFRVFRNAVLKNYRAFFDIAARYVILAARAYAYEFDARSDGEDVLAGIYRERRLGGQAGLEGGLQGVLTRLDGAVTVNNFNRPLEVLGDRNFRFSFRENFLGIGRDDFPSDDLRFRAFLESSIVERLEDLHEIRDLAQVSSQRDFGPAIVIPFASEIDGRNFFGFGPELPFGNSNFSITRNAKIRNFAIRFDGVDTSLGIDPESGAVAVYLLPAGDSILRENTNKMVIEDELITPWAVVDQFLPRPTLAAGSDLTRRAFSPWRSTAQAGGNFLNEIKRQRDSEAQVELGQPLRFNSNLAGRSAWNTRWLLVIPGGQWTGSSDPAEIRHKLLQFIYGESADPAAHFGIINIHLILQAYSH